MKKIILILNICLLILLGTAGNSVAKDKVAWFKSGSTSKFWPVVEEIMVAAAEDLQLDVDIYEYDNDLFYMVALVKEVLADPARRPDCILIHNYKNNGEKILALAEQFGVPVFVFNAGFAPDSQVGTPREKYPHWIGQILPDDESGGYLLAKELIAKGTILRKNTPGPLQMVALTGDRSSNVSTQRIKGLQRALAEHPEVINNQFFHSKWKRDLAKEAFKTTRYRYPETTIFWAASETMSLGVIDAAKEQGLIVGEDIITGGFDLLPHNKKYIETGEMTASVGGHYFEAAWALVLIYDYLHGMDFATEQTSFTTKMISQTREDLTGYNNLYTILSTPLLGSLDFGRLSKYLNPAVKKYNFDLDTFLQNSTQ